MMLFRRLSLTLGAALLALSTTAQAEEVSLGFLSDTGGHELGGEVILVSESVLEVRNFRYDGAGPDAYFFADSASSLTSGGFRLRDAAPSALCGVQKLPRGDGQQTWRVEFPPDTSIQSILGGSIGVWCERFSVSFGQVSVPNAFDQAIVSTDAGPALECFQGGGGVVPAIAMTPNGYNCEELHENFQVRWQVQGDQLAVELIGKLNDFEYMSFGPSGKPDETFMLGADVVVADITDEGEARVRDFFLSSRSQCSGGQGVCPDSDGEGGLTNDVSNVSGEQESGLTLIRYTRPLTPTDVAATIGGFAADAAISAEAGISTFIAWALGPISMDTDFPQFHSTVPREDVSVEFGRTVADNCVPFKVVVGGAPEDDDAVPFFRPVVRATELVARIGPSGGERGYEAISGGRAGWGIAWYINDLLVPVVEMVRGRTYTFIISGGDDENTPAEYHPFYLTDSISGGYIQLSPEEQAQEKIFAGIEISDVSAQEGDGKNITPTLVAPICQYRTTDATSSLAEDAKFPAFFDTLETSCADNTAITSAAIRFEFTLDETTPDKLYYQCATHRNLGWEIIVRNEGDDPITEMPTPPLASSVEGSSAFSLTGVAGSSLGTILSLAVLGVAGLTI